MKQGKVLFKIYRQVEMIGYGGPLDQNLPGLIKAKVGPMLNKNLIEPWEI